MINLPTKESTMLLSYHNDQKVKQFYLDRILQHEIADEIVQGQYWEDGKGCAVGCLIHGSDHAKFTTTDGPGWPEWLARLCDTIFEGLPNDKAKLFPRRVVEAIPVGANLEPVKWRFAVMLMEENIKRVKSLAIDESFKKQVIDAIEQVANLNRSAVVTGAFDESAARSAERSAAWSAESAERSAAWSSAWSAVMSAAWSAESAARSAARSSESAARSAARSSARSAESAAWSEARSAAAAAWSAVMSAAWSAESEARSAARSAESAAYVRYSDKLLGMLLEARP